MSAVTGDFAAVAKLVQSFKALAGEGTEAALYKHNLFKQCAEGARHALDDEFIYSRDPYGNPWKPLSMRVGKPLVDTGRLASSWTYRVTAKGFSIETNVAYAATHQYGAVILPVVAKRLAWQVRGSKRWHFSMKSTIPKRQMIPQSDTGGIGDTWQRAINDEAEAFMADWFK